jgi:gamma-glutamylcyclotransferase (GGCT)/AIG2-like uncharacterized protein YtfP
MSHPGIYHLFVYGSLRSGFTNPAYEYISNFFQLIGEARVRGLLFDMGTYPAAIPSPGDHFIVGELYEARNPGEFSWAIGQLDDYEGVGAEADEVQLYRRELTEVYIKGGMIQAWVYWFNGDVHNRPFIPSGDVMDYQRKKLST